MLPAESDVALIPAHEYLLTVTYDTATASPSATLISKIDVTGQSFDVNETAKTDGLKIGNTATAAENSAVKTVTNGMLVDKNGNAVTDESKAIAKLTIADSGDAIVY